MSKKYVRIAVSLPSATLKAADHLARQADRSRSWVIAEAVRRYADAAQDQAPVGVQAGLGESRLAQLVADLRLTPEQRVKAAEDTVRSTPSRRARVSSRVMSFDTFEDYLHWKSVEAALR